MPSIPRRGLAVAALLAALPFAAACAPADTTTAAPTPVVATTPVAATPALPAPAEITDLIARMLDPAVPNADKIGHIQGIHEDPDLPNRLAETPARHDARLAVTITDTRLGPPGMLATGTARINDGEPHPVIVNFVAEDGVWKVEKAWYCQIAFSFMVQSSACPR